MSDPNPGSSEMSKWELSKLPRGAISMSGAPIARNARLPSIKGPRDLTLGSSGKRVFTPNIPVRREKKVVEDKASSNAGSSKGAGQRGTRGGGNRGRGKKSSFVQTPGAVFGEGVGALQKNVTSRSNDYSPRVASIQKPAIKSDVKIKTEALDDAELSDQFIDDSDVEVDWRLSPIIIPVKNTGKAAQQKEEDDDSTSAFDDKKENPESEQLPHTLDQLLTPNESNGNSDLILIELTDYIESILHLNNQDEAVSNKENEAGNSNQKEKPLLNIANLPSGPIGKLQILADGSTRLVVGDHIFNGFLEPPSPFLQEVVTIQQSDTDTHLNVLGQIMHVAKFLPEIDMKSEGITTTFT